MVTATAIARCGELEFEAVDLVDDSSLERITARLVEVAEGDGKGVLLEGLPAFLSWLDRSDAPAPSIVRMQLAVLEALALMPGWETAGLEIAADLMMRILDFGPSSKAYGEMLDAMDVIWARMASRRHSAWFADLVEVLEFHPGDRDRLLATLVTGVNPLRGQILPLEVREGLLLTGGSLNAALDVEPADHAEVESVPHGVRPGRTVGIYSLSPQVAARARERLEKRYPNLKVIHREDKVATTGLLSMVQSADLLVVAIGSAKHAATDAIDAHRPKALPTLRHAFRGSTRIVEAVEGAIAAGTLA